MRWAGQDRWQMTFKRGTPAQRGTQRFKRQGDDLQRIPRIRRWRPTPEELLSIIATWVVIIAVGLLIWLALMVGGLAWWWAS